MNNCVITGMPLFKPGQVRDIYDLGDRLLIVASDTKFSFGLADGRLMLIDELLTPESSRFWLVESYQPGGAPESFGRQYVRDYLLSLKWDTRPPVPTLPPEVVQKTQENYFEALQRLTAPPARCFGR